MFHTYVLSSSGNSVDFDRASFLMDRDILDASLEAFRRAHDTGPRPDVAQAAQWVWEHYCRTHVEKYAEAFVADADPTWDRPETPLTVTEPGPGSARTRYSKRSR